MPAQDQPAPDRHLLTPRMVLRQWRPDDASALFAVDSDPEVMRYIGDGSVRTFEQTVEAIDRFQQRWAEQGFGLFAAELIETGELAGWIGLAVPLFLPEVLPAVEIGWRLARRFWGVGLATEGARAVLADGFDRCGLDEVLSIRHVDNTASARVMTKLGFTDSLRTVVPSHGQPVVVVRLPRDDHRPSGDHTG